LLYLIFASIEGMCGPPNGAPFCTSYLGDTADLIFRNGAGAVNRARTYAIRQDMPGWPNYAHHQMALVASLEGGGNAYATVSESEVICDLRCGGKAKGTHLWASVFEGVRTHTYLVTSRDFVGEEIRFGVRGLQVIVSYLEPHSSK
jgi:hypothetical protein